MVNKKVLFIVAIALVTALMLSSFAVTRNARSQETEPTLITSLFLKIGDLSIIQGESMNQNHQGWIDIEAFNWSEAMASVTAASARRLSMQDFCFITETSTASPQLFLATASGRLFSTAQLDCCIYSGETQLTYLQFLFEHVRVTSYNIMGNTSMYHPLDQFSISFGKITMNYWRIMPDGSTGGIVTAHYP